MATLPIVPSPTLDGGELVVDDASDVLALLPIEVRRVVTAPVRDALASALAEIFLAYQTRATQGADLGNVLRSEGVCLDGLAADYDRYRQPGESDAALRVRILSLDAMVTPEAIVDLVNALLATETRNEARYFESELDQWFVHDGADDYAWDSFVFDDVAVSPRYPDRLYLDDSSENDSDYLYYREVAGAWSFRDTLGRYFVLRLPDVSDALFVTIVATVELFKGQGMRWQLYVDPLVDVPCMCLESIMSNPITVTSGDGVADTNATTETLTGTMNVTLPARSNGDLVVLAVVNKSNGVTTATPSGWTLASQFVPVATAPTHSAGSITLQVFTRLVDGTETSPVPLDKTGMAGILAQPYLCTKASPTATWGSASAVGEDTSAGTAFSVTAGANPGLQALDTVLMFAGLNALLDVSGRTVAAEGVDCFRTATALAADANGGGSNTGDCSLLGSAHSVKCGTSTAAPVFTMTAIGATGSQGKGAAVFVRLRQVP